MDSEKWNVLLEAQLVNGVYHSSLGELYVKEFPKYAPSTRFPRVLRIGWGEGQVESNTLAILGYQATTITIQPWQQAVQMDMHDLAFRPDSFDAVYAIQTFEHSYAPWLLLMECWTVLRMGGILYFVVPTPNLHHVFTHPNLLSEEQWLNGLDMCGFKTVGHFTKRYQVKCRCEDDYGHLKGFETDHDVTCITVVGEKAVPARMETVKTLEGLRTIHERDRAPVGAV